MDKGQIIFFFQAGKIRDKKVCFIKNSLNFIIIIKILCSLSLVLIFFITSFLDLFKVLNISFSIVCPTTFFQSFPFCSALHHKIFTEFFQAFCFHFCQHTCIITLLKRKWQPFYVKFFNLPLNTLASISDVVVVFSLLKYVLMEIFLSFEKHYFLISEIFTILLPPKIKMIPT